MATEKTIVIRRLWKVLQEENPPRMTVLKSDVQKAIEWCRDNAGTTLDHGNVPNFMKDFLRGGRASLNWPEELSEQRITAKQVTGRQADGAPRIFEFLPFAQGQSEAFPEEVTPTAGQPPVMIQSVSLPLTTKSLGRSDESWLIQVAVNLRVFEHHFATISPLDVRELTHLQVGVKMGGRSEIDSLFLAVVQWDGKLVRALVTCEAKQNRDRILKDQIVQQVTAAYHMVKSRGLDIDLVIPVAIKAVPPNGEVFVVEFDHWLPAEAECAEEDRKSLEVACSATYRLVPPVIGVGYTEPRRRATRGTLI